ncbi:hypothetical protein JB92DRAFT_2825574 [Gautieria morchelliformis]|nr:hypothetical protein JB92DRAFT_2825574 [Gautieria morchelliformis]
MLAAASTNIVPPLSICLPFHSQHQMIVGVWVPGIWKAGLTSFIFSCRTTVLVAIYQRMGRHEPLDPKDSCLGGTPRQGDLGVAEPLWWQTDGRLDDRHVHCSCVRFPCTVRGYGGSRAPYVDTADGGREPYMERAYGSSAPYVGRAHEGFLGTTPEEIQEAVNVNVVGAFAFARETFWVSKTCSVNRLTSAGKRGTLLFTGATEREEGRRQLPACRGKVRYSRSVPEFEQSIREAGYPFILILLSPFIFVCYYR